MASRTLESEADWQTDPKISKHQKQPQKIPEEWKAIENLEGDAGVVL